jgi:muramoyltetrapeptide carboxypeptidase
LRLERGDLVGVVAPGFAVPVDSLEAGAARLEHMGFRVRLGDYVRSRHGYLAGTDAERAGDLERVWLDPEVRAIWFARGGYGAARLLDRLPWRRLRRTSKILIGYSDSTAILAPASDRTGCRTVYGPVVTELANPDLYDRPSLRAALVGRAYELRFPSSHVVRPGAAEGRLVGGNLSVLVHLLGTKWFPKLDGAILALEEVGEETYRIDRLLVQLRQSGALRGVSGILLGRIRPVPRRAFPPDRPLRDVVSEILLPLDLPVVRDLPFGHVARKRTLPLGARVVLDTDARVVRFEPADSA